MHLAVSSCTAASCFFCLIALFGFLRHGAWISDRLLDTADRILGDPGERLASKMVGAVRGTVNGTVLVAFAEGLLKDADTASAFAAQFAEFIVKE